MLSDLDSVGREKKVRLKFNSLKSLTQIELTTHP